MRAEYRYWEPRKHVPQVYYPLRSNRNQDSENAIQFVACLFYAQMLHPALPFNEGGD